MSYEYMDEMDYFFTMYEWRRDVFYLAVECAGLLRWPFIRIRKLSRITGESGQQTSTSFTNIHNKKAEYNIV
jgi:hypothetical protein